MNVRSAIISIASPGLLVLAMSAMRFTVADSHDSSRAHNELEACTLLSNSDAANALEVPSTSSKRLVEASPRGCIWSNDPAASDSSRRVALVLHAPAAFQAAMHTVITTIKIEPVAGVGDNAFYQVFPADSPMLWVLKANTAFSLRIMTHLKPAPFTTEQEKAKEAVLGKAVAAKL